MIWLVAILMVAGSAFALIATIGVFRMPDLYMRMHAATKAGAFGASLMLLAAALHFGSLRALLTAVLVIVFFYMTAPVAAQTVAEAAYRKGVKLWPASRVDHLAEAKSKQHRKDKRTD